MPDRTTMSAKQFKAWRKGLGLSQKEAAAALGLKHRIIQYYEKGERHGKPVAIPKTVRLACYALVQQIDDFDGERAWRVEPVGELTRKGGKKKAKANAEGAEPIAVVASASPE